MKGNVTCSCGHSWSKSKSSKEDMNVCHICGKDNTMKDGGWLDQYQEGGNVAVSDATRTKFTKNTGLKKGVDQPISNMLDITLGAPQRQLVRMITGKEQYPSEAMGIENPYGAFAADAILDPTNLVGAGLLGKAAKASTKTGVLSKAYKINPFAFKPKPNAQYRMIGEEGLKDALESGVIRNNPKGQYVKDAPYFSEGFPINGRQYKTSQSYGNYGGPNMVEVTGENFIKGVGPKSKSYITAPINELNISNPNVKFYKEHWLKGYKEVPKKENGGWLEKYNDGGPVQPNYNDYSVSAGPGFEGDGYSNVGRNYSPAWGGQFQKGGTIYTTNPKDPRLKAYQDSLSAFNSEKTYLNKFRNSYTLKDKKEYWKAQDNNYSPQNFPLGLEPIATYASTDMNGPDNNPDYIYKYKKPTQTVKYINRVKQTETPELQDLPIGLPVDISLPELRRPAGPNRITMGKPLFPGGPQTDYYTPIDEAGNVVQSNDFRTSQFAMGGSLPGATGHFYARYSSGGSMPGDADYNAPRTGQIPNNGKYAKKTMASAQNGMEMKYYQEGLDFKPKTISRNGSVIKDDMGQWAHPGEITEIGSNQITMQGVPYPVLGISDTGDMQIMYPDEEYEYDGESVTEYPMMKQGGQLTKLDQLSNFTNYNTKQPGSWLDKYQ